MLEGKSKLGKKTMALVPVLQGFQEDMSTHYAYDARFSWLVKQSWRWLLTRHKTETKCAVSNAQIYKKMRKKSNKRCAHGHKNYNVAHLHVNVHQYQINVANDAIAML